MTLRFRSVGRSDVGLVREGNEDSAYAGTDCLLVADGVGGAAAGEVASATTAYVVSASAALAGDRPREEVLRDAVALAQAQLRAGIEQRPERDGMASTLTAMLTDGEEVWLAHLGDSRGYLVHEGALTRVTRDDTWVQALIDEGRLTPQEVSRHPWRSVVLRVVNGETTPAPTLQRLDVAPGDRLMVASDGLTDLVGDDEIAEVLGVVDDDEVAVDALVSLALDRGGHDNVTVALARVEQGDPTPGEGRLLGAATDPYLVIDPAAVRSTV